MAGTFSRLTSCVQVRMSGISARTQLDYVRLKPRSFTCCRAERDGLNLVNVKATADDLNKCLRVCVCVCSSFLQPQLTCWCHSSNDIIRPHNVFIVQTNAVWGDRPHGADLFVEGKRPLCVFN